MAEKRKRIKKSPLKRVIQIIGTVICLLMLTVVGYLVYVLVDYHRIADNQTLDVESPVSVKAETGTEYTLVTWNLGFGAYSDDYTFFMDGGKESRAYSENAVYANINGAVNKLKEINPDFMFLQEIDFDATRSYHVDERVPITAAFPDMSYVFAVNYDSPYLFYPVTSPHGASKAGIMTLSDYSISSAVRRSLPIESGFRKFLDLDRCFSVSKAELENGKQLVLINLHLSAYSEDGGIATEQLKMLIEVMREEADAGNYVICGGDFNKDLLGNSPDVFGVISDEPLSWAQPIPEGTIPEDFTLVVGFDAEAPVPTTRNTDIPYQKGVSFCATIDGFIVSSNVTVVSCETLDYGFENSDHNPAVLKFTLN
ncbi:MAG: endonuclease/exonuclease/phosphatase family protein [Eubacteriales bacterium]|nr:endonuclease/exonuclease/phosphatase family protein [Eubacteriales bacterium]